MDSRGVATEFFSIGLGVGLESVFFLKFSRSFRRIVRIGKQWTWLAEAPSA